MFAGGGLVVAPTASELAPTGRLERLRSADALRSRFRAWPFGAGYPGPMNADLGGLRQPR